MSPEEWDATSWDVQLAYAEGMAAEGLYEQVAGPGRQRHDADQGGQQGPDLQGRTVEVDAKVIDLQQLIRDSEAAQAAQAAQAS